MPRLVEITLLTVTFIPFCLGQEACVQKMSAKEKASFAKLYGDMLIAQSMWKNDTLRQKKMIDSILKGTEFGNSDEVKEWLKEMTVSDPEGVRQMLDSTQAYLEKVRNPTPVPSPSKTTQSDSQP